MSDLIPHPISGLPQIYDGATWRTLGRIRTDRPKMLVAPYAASNPVLDLSTLADYDRWQSNVPILDQAQIGSCVGHGSTSAVMKSRDQAGYQFVALSADSLYAQIDRDVDQGSDPADAITALEQNGVCTLAEVPDSFVLWRNIPDSAKVNAKRFRIAAEGVYQCANFAEMVSADALGFAIILTINVGVNFGPGANGVVGFAGGWANHCVSGGEAYRTVNGVGQYRFRNSWTTGWGISGCAWMTARHIDQQSQAEVYAIKWALPDPQDPTNPPI